MKEKGESLYRKTRSMIAQELTRITGREHIASHDAVYEAIRCLQQKNILTEQLATLLSHLYAVCSFTSQEREKIERLREAEWATREGPGILEVLKKVQT